MHGDIWRDLWAPLGAIGAVVLVAVGWYFGLMSEATTAAVVALAAAVIAFVIPLILAEIALPSGLDRALAAVILLGSAAIFLTEAGVQVFPGKPLASLSFRGDVREQAFERPAGGDVRLVTRTDMVHQAGSRLAYRLVLKSGSDRQSVEGAFSRSSGGGKGGGGGVSATHGAVSHLVPLGGAAGPVTVTLAAWESPSAILYLDVFRARCPHNLLLGLQLGLLALALVARRRIGRVSTRIWLVHAAAFGVFLAWSLPGALTPDEPVMPFFGTIVLSGVGGALVGEVLGWIALRGRYGEVGLR